MMTYQEKWEHDRNIDEIVERLSALLMDMMLLNIKQINERVLEKKNLFNTKESNDITI